jgi:serine protease
MRRLLLLLAVTAVIPGCSCEDLLDEEPLPTGGGAAGPGGRVSGTVTPFQGATSWRGQARVDEGLRRALSSSVTSPPRVARVNGLGHALRSPLRPELTATGRLHGAHEPPRFITSEVVVRLHEKLPAARALELLKVPGLVASHGGFSSEYLHLVRYRHQQTDKPLSPAETQELVGPLAARPGVVFVELNAVHHPLALPNDNLYPAMWHLPPINMPAAWELERGATAAVTVAVVDTGLFAHPDLTPRALPGADFISDPAMSLDGDGRDTDATDTGRDLPNGQSSWHGTHCAGTIGAATDNGTGIAGLNWNARIVPVRVLGRGGGSTADIAAGMAWASGLTVPGMPANPNPAQVVSLSLGGEGGPQQTYQDVIDQASARNVIFVVAAGNDNIDATRFTPCNQSGVICVGATRFNGRRASYSNFGSRIDVMAPGGEVAEDANGDGYPDGVLSTFRNDDTGMPTYVFEQGTSMATPHVAGLVSLMKARNPSLTFAQVRQILVDTANPASRCNEGCGAGLINAHAALLRTTNSQPTGPARLALSATDLFFTQASSTQVLTITNTGGMPLSVTVAAGGANGQRLSFDGTQRSIAPGQSAAVQISANLQGLTDGRIEAATVTVSSNGGNASVGVKLRAGGASGQPVTVALIYQEGQEFKVGAAVDAQAAQNFAFTLSAPAGRYFLLGAQDTNGNGQFEDNEPLGLWPNTDSPRELTVADGQMVTGANFVVAPQGNVSGNESRLIGTACTDDSTCGEGGICGTGFPAGYCTKDCSTASCPVGSKCLSGASVSLCLDTCTAPRSGRSSCRQDYVCEDDGSGQGVCIPACATIQDFCDAPQRCNASSGYCE